jgi:hypothetical protein
MKAAISPKARPAIRQPMAAPATAPPEIPPEDPPDDPSEDAGDATAEPVFDVEAVDVMPFDVSPVPLSLSSASAELVVKISDVPASNGFDVAVFVAVGASVVTTPITSTTVTFCSGATRISAAATVLVKLPSPAPTISVAGFVKTVLKGLVAISVMGWQRVTDENDKCEWKKSKSKKSKKRGSRNYEESCLAK